MQTKFTSFLSLFLAAFLLIGCSFSRDPNSKTQIPNVDLPDAKIFTMEARSTSAVEPTQIFSIINSTNTPEGSPNITETPEILDEPISNTSTPDLGYQRTPTLTPTPNIPEGIIQIHSPGYLSKVISPIKVISYAQPGFAGKVFIELIGEDGQVLFHEFRTFQDLPRLWAPINLELPFAISAVAEYARLQIFTEDQFYRISELRSVNILLQSDGLNKIYPNSILKERCIVNSPAPLEAISGGIIVVEGQFLPFNDQPLIIELINEKGLIIGTGIVAGEKNDEGLYNLFKSEISYQVPTSTSVRLTVRQQDDHVPGDLFVYSQIILLQP